MKDDAFVGLLAMADREDDAIEKIQHSIVRSQGAEPRLAPDAAALRPDRVHDRYVDFDTTKDTFTTRSDLCHLSHVVCRQRLGGRAGHASSSTTPGCGPT